MIRLFATFTRSLTKRIFLANIFLILFCFRLRAFILIIISKPIFFIHVTNSKINFKMIRNGRGFCSSGSWTLVQIVNVVAAVSALRRLADSRQLSVKLRVRVSRRVKAARAVTVWCLWRNKVIAASQLLTLPQPGDPLLLRLVRRCFRLLLPGNRRRRGGPLRSDLTSGGRLAGVN